MEKIIYAQKMDIFDKKNEHILSDLIKEYNFEQIDIEIEMIENHIRYAIIRYDNELLHQIQKILKLAKKTLKDLKITLGNRKEINAIKKVVNRLYNLSESVYNFNVLSIGIEKFELIPHSLNILQIIIERENNNLKSTEIDILQNIFNKFTENQSKITSFDDAEIIRSVNSLEEINMIIKEDINYKLTVKGYNIFNFYTSTKRVTNKIEKIKRENKI